MNNEAVNAELGLEPGLELDLQELESAEAPGFWTGVSIGAGVVSAVAVSVASIT